MVALRDVGRAVGPLGEEVGRLAVVARSLVKMCSDGVQPVVVGQPLLDAVECSEPGERSVDLADRDGAAELDEGIMSP